MLQDSIIYLGNRIDVRNLNIRAKRKWEYSVNGKIYGKAKSRGQAVSAAKEIADRRNQNRSTDSTFQKVEV